MSLFTCCVALLVTLVAAVSDARTGRIPNWLTLPVLVLGPVWAALHGGMLPVLLSLIGVSLCGLVPLLLFVRDAMGGGDVKLFAALGGIFGPIAGIEVQFFSFLIVVFLLMAKMAWDGRLFAMLRNVLVAGGHLFLPKRYHRPLEPAMLTTMRMGISIFVATAVSVAMRAPLALWLS
jgi:prepilin peptidase CpaA